jgi:RHS repeat-associated protein
VGGALIGMRSLQVGSVTTRYFHADNLGSIAVITNESGAVVERNSYDAWGKRRFPTGADDPSGNITSQTTRGFTGQEELADVGLVHLNGRVYDPLIGRMMSADSVVPDPLNAQAWHRYSYVINNPLALTDPSGHSWLSTFLGRTFGVLFRKFPIFGELLEIGAVLLCGGNPVCAVPVAFASTTFVAGVTSGNLGYALKAGFIAGITALANFDVGLLGQALGGPGGYLLNAAGKALVGCGMSVASGGKCGSGALAGGVSALASPLTNGPDRFANLVMNSTVGGLASVAGGGKFANGAITGAFGYLLIAGQQDPSQAYDPSQTYGQAGPSLVGSFLRPFIEFDIGTLGARLPPLPPGWTAADFGRLMEWGQDLDAGPWIDRLTNDPAFAQRIAQNAKEAGFTSDWLGQWTRWYQDNSTNWNPTSAQPDAPPQFQFRSDGLGLLQNLLPSVPASVGLSACARNPRCT